MKIKFCISSNLKHYKKSYSVLVPSLIKSGIDIQDIYFFVGGHTEYRKEIDQINLFYTDHNSFDFTALISLIDLNLRSDYWFLLHDTCYVGQNFYNNIKEFKYDTQTVRLYSGPSMNIGAYNQSYIDSVKDNILSYKNKNYDLQSCNFLKSKLVHDEDIFFKNSTCKSYTNNIRHEGPVDFYGNGILRLIEHFDDIDFHKMKANWNPKSIYELNL